MGAILCGLKRVCVCSLNTKTIKLMQKTDEMILSLILFQFDHICCSDRNTIERFSTFNFI